MKFQSVVLALLSFAALSTHAAKPNFVFILGEGQGWTSLSTQMDRSNPRSKSDFFYTPNLDRVAAEGMRFSRFYAPSPRCTPSRATYFTGISPAALRMTFVNIKDSASAAEFTSSLPTSVITIAERLKPAGYATAHFGKWHVGRPSPEEHGFDESDGSTGNSDQFRSPNPNPKQFDMTADKGIAFMTKNARAGCPFYLQISHYPGRSALDAKPETVEFMKKRTGNRDPRFLTGAAVALDADTATGRVLDAIKKLGIEDNTYFIYTTDHGTPGRNGLLNSGKGSVYDGGLRVPLIVRGPGIRPNTFADALTTGADIYPTISDLAGITTSLPKPVEGGSLKSLLLNSGKGTVTRRREEYVVHFPHYDHDPAGPASAIYLGDYKLIHYYAKKQNLLFNLRTDIGERNDLATQQPTKVAELVEQMNTYLHSVNAAFPTIDPNRQITQRKRKGDKVGKGGLKPRKPKGKKPRRPVQ
jgi:arylsulfatase A